MERSGSDEDSIMAKYNLPKQGNHLNKEVRVCFEYDTNEILHGLIVRDDMEPPFLTLIRLNDGRYIQTTECQYSLAKEKE